jgi:hypothetical protein
MAEEGGQKDSQGYICRPVIGLAADSIAEAPTTLVQRKLKTLSDRLDKVHTFTKGQFVKWKPGLKNRKFPDYGEPAIVTGILLDPIFDPNEISAASPYFQEPLTIVVGVHQDDDFLEYRVDGRRFEPIE